MTLGLLSPICRYTKQHILRAQHYQLLEECGLLSCVANILLEKGLQERICTHSLDVLMHLLYYTIMSDILAKHKTQIQPNIILKSIYLEKHQFCLILEASCQIHTFTVLKLQVLMYNRLNNSVCIL